MSVGGQRQGTDELNLKESPVPLTGRIWFH